MENISAPSNLVHFLFHATMTVAQIDIFALTIKLSIQLLTQLIILKSQFTSFHSFLKFFLKMVVSYINRTFRRLLLIKLVLILNVVASEEILGCGGFIKSHADIDFSKVEVKL